MQEKAKGWESRPILQFDERRNVRKIIRWVPGVRPADIELWRRAYFVNLDKIHKFCATFPSSIKWESWDTHHRVTMS